MDETSDADPTGERGTMPEPLAHVESGRIHDLDVRDQLRQGGEPFERIMAAGGGISDDGVLRVRAIFEPRPLYAVMASRGFESWTEKLGEEDWRVWFWRPAATGD